MKNNNEETEAAEAILLLSKDVFSEKSSDGLLAFLRASSWEREITESTFEMHERDNRVKFAYSFLERVWSLEVLAGIVKIFDRAINKDVGLVINNGTIINLGNLEFIFYYFKPKRPQKSYQKLICEAIESTPDKRMTLSQIYDFFVNKAGFNLSDANTWKNSIRHNLSLNKIFIKIPRDKHELQGKGAFWGIDYQAKEEYNKIVSSTPPSYSGNIKVEMSHLRSNNHAHKMHQVVKLKQKLSDCKKINKEKRGCEIKTKGADKEPVGLLIYQKPSSVSFLIKNTLDKNISKRKIGDNFCNAKKRKLNFLQIETSCMKANYLKKKIIDRQNYLYNIETESLFKPVHVAKDRRSQSIIELSKEFDSLSLYGGKSKDRNKKKF